MVVPTSISFYPILSNISSRSVNLYSYGLINLDSDQPIKYLSSSYVNSSGYQIFNIQMSQIIFTNKLSQAFLNQNKLLNDGAYEYRYWNNQTLNNNINQVNSNVKSLSPPYQINSLLSGDHITGPYFSTVLSSVEIRHFYGFGSIITETLSFPTIFSFSSISFRKYYSFPYGCGKANESSYITNFSQQMGDNIQGLLNINIGESIVFTNSISTNNFLVKTEALGNFYFIGGQSSTFDFAAIKASGYDDMGMYSNIFTPSLGQFKDFTTFTAYSIDLKVTQLSKFLIPRVPNLLEIIEAPTINSIKFEVQTMNTTDVGGLNTVYLGFDQFDISGFSIFYHPSFILSPRSLSSNIHFHKAIPFTWDESKGLFKADFFVPGNLPTGEVDYSIVNNIGTEYPSNYIKSYLASKPSSSSSSFSNNKVNDTSLYTYSEYGYSLPPLIRSFSFEKDTIEIYDLQNLNNIYLTIQLQPTRNPFDNGFISIVSSTISAFRKIYYNFTFTNDQLVTGTNDTFKFELVLPCFSSRYDIINVTLIDKQGYTSSFNKFSIIDDIHTAIPLPIDPFMIFNEIKGFNVICYVQPTNQLSTPKIISLNSNLLNDITINKK
ncbi:hypothetical protein ACTA71_012139 [Dictyostelium dimigraforme]